MATGLAVKNRPQESGAGEIGGRRVSEATGVGFGPVEDALDCGRWVWHRGRVVDKGELRFVPGGFAALNGGSEVFREQRVGVGDKVHVGEESGPVAEPRIRLLTGAEVVAINPDEVDSAIRIAARLQLGEDPVQGILRVGNGYSFECDSLRCRGRSQHVVDVGIALIVAAPHP
nr:hypothetical protein [Salinibacterium sp. PAMC 21357]